jgi:hypothetical protein
VRTVRLKITPLAQSSGSGLSSPPRGTHCHEVPLNGGSRAVLTVLLATVPPAPFGRNGFAVVPDFSFTVLDLPDMHVVLLHGEFDIVSAEPGRCPSEGR